MNCAQKPQMSTTDISVNENRSLNKTDEKTLRDSNGTWGKYTKPEQTQVHINVDKRECCHYVQTCSERRKINKIKMNQRAVPKWNETSGRKLWKNSRTTGKGLRAFIQNYTFHMNVECIKKTAFGTCIMCLCCWTILVIHNIFNHRNWGPC